MAEQYSVEAIISAIDKGFSKQLDDMSNKLAQFEKNTQKTQNSNEKAGSSFKVFALAQVAGNYLTKLTGDIVSLMKESFNASDAINKFKSTMQFAGIDNSAIEKATADAKKYADETVYDLDTITNTTAQLAANGIKDYTGLTQAAGNLNAVAGGNANTFKSVAMVMTQTAGAGKLTAENWRQLSDAIPGASGKIQEALKKNGAYTGDFRKAMEKGQITAEEFNKAIMDLGMTDVAREAATSTQTIEGAVGNMQAGIVTSINKIIDAIGKDNITNAITVIGNGITYVLDKVASVVPSIIDFFKKIYSVVEENKSVFIRLGVALAVLNFTSIIGGISSFVMMILRATQVTKILTLAQILFNSVLKANPIMLIISLIAGLIAYFVHLYNINEEFRNKVLTVWNAIKGVFIGAWEVIKVAWSKCKDFFTNLWNGLVNIATTVWSAVVQTIMMVVQPFMNNFITLWNGLKEGLFQMLEGVKMIFQGAWEFIKSIVLGAILIVIDIVTGNFGKLKEDMQAIWNNIKNAVETIWNGIKTYLSGLVSVLVGYLTAMWEILKNAVTTIWNAIKNIASNVWNAIKSTVVSIVLGLVNRAKQAWEDLKQSVSNVVESVKNFFNRLWNIDLFGAGKAILQGFLNGLKSMWNSVTGFIGGIADWIRENKGPISYDRKLLIPAGNVIMEGLDKGLASGYKDVQNRINSMSASIASDFNISSKLSYKNEVNTVQPLSFNFKLGDKTFRGFVDDVNSVNYENITLQEIYGI